MELVIVGWVDSRTRGGWLSREEYLELSGKPAECVSVGWLLEDTDDHLTLLQSASELWVSDSMTIPRGCVVYITRTGYHDELS